MSYGQARQEGRQAPGGQAINEVNQSVVEIPLTQGQVRTLSSEIAASNQESVRKVVSTRESPKGEAREHSLKFLRKALMEKKRPQRKAAGRK